MAQRGTPSHERRQAYLLWQSPKAASSSHGERSGYGALQLGQDYSSLPCSYTVKRLR
jgi:hypothetical protein